MIGDEARLQWAERFGGLPDSVVACVGGGSNAIGIFRAFMDDDVALFGVEAAGSGLQTERHAATLTQGKTGVLHGAKTLVLSDADGQILEAHSVSAGLDYPGVGPEHAALQASGRAHYLAVDDEAALSAAHQVARTEGILIALETAHAFRGASSDRRSRSEASGSSREDLGLLVGARGQGSRDADGANDVTAARIDDCMATCKGAGRPALIIYLTIGDPSVADSLACARAALDAGADILELGVPFSDPSADGPTIADASRRAIAGGGSLRAALDVARQLRESSQASLVLFTYMNPVISFGEAELPRAAAAAGIDALLIVDLPPEEGQALRSAAAGEELAVIPLLAPTTPPERMAMLAKSGRGFAYYVSVTGVTGSKQVPLEAAAQAATSLSREHGLPVVVGFGIDSADKAGELARAGVDGVVVGSAVVRKIAAGSDAESRAANTRGLVAELSAALEGSR